MMKASCVFLLAAAGFFLSSAGASRPTAGMNRNGRGLFGAVRRLHDFEEESDCTAPGSMSSFSGVIGASKLAAPTSGDQVDNADLQPYCSQYFKMEGDYCRFMTDDERSELRIPTNENGNGEGFSVSSVTASLKGTLRLVKTNIGASEHYTWMQVHGEDTSWIRLAHYGQKNVEGQDADAINWMWLFIKTGSSSSNEITSVPMGPVPDGDFQASIELSGGKVTISAGEFSETYDISWSDSINYFKAGVYVQEGNPSDFLVDYKSISYEGPSSTDGGSTAVAVSPAEDDEDAEAPAPTEDYEGEGEGDED